MSYYYHQVNKNFNNADCLSTATVHAVPFSPMLVARSTQLCLSSSGVDILPFLHSMLGGPCSLHFQELFVLIGK